MRSVDDLVKLEHEAEKFGFKWQEASQIIEQIESEIEEVKEQLASPNKEALKEEVADLMHAVFSLSIFLQYSPNELIHNSVEKFSKRFAEVKRLAKNDGLTSVNHLNFSELMAYWDEAKEKVG